MYARMSQVELQIENFSTCSAHSIVLYLHSQNGGTTSDCDSQLSMLTSNYYSL